MNLVRGVGRLLLGGFYIVNGVKSIREPGRYVAQVEPVADHDAVRLDARRDRRCVLRPDGRARKEQCYC